MAKKKPYRIFVYLALRSVAGLIFVIPRRVALTLAGRLGRMAYFVIKRQSGRTYLNLHRVYGHEKSEQELHAIGAHVFKNLAKTAVEVLQFPKMTPDRLSRMVEMGDSLKTYEAILKEGNGLISITAHIGNWELLAGTFAMRGLPGAIVARRIYYEPYNQWIVGLRSALRLRTIYREHASRDIMRLLKKGAVVGMLPDQDMASLQGMFVDFFGKPAFTTVAPVRLSLATGAPIVVNFLIREKRDRYRVYLSDVIRPRIETSREAALKDYTQAWMTRFEEMIRQFPDQWGWMHDRWKTQMHDLEEKKEGVLIQK